MGGALSKEGTTSRSNSHPSIKPWQETGAYQRGNQEHQRGDRVERLNPDLAWTLVCMTPSWKFENSWKVEPFLRNQYIYSFTPLQSIMCASQSATPALTGSTSWETRSVSFIQFVCSRPTIRNHMKSRRWVLKIVGLHRCPRSSTILSLSSYRSRWSKLTSLDSGRTSENLEWPADLTRRLRIVQEALEIHVLKKRCSGVHRAAQLYQLLDFHTTIAWRPNCFPSVLEPTERFVSKCLSCSRTPAGNLFSCCFLWLSATNWLRRDIQRYNTSDVETESVSWKG